MKRALAIAAYVGSIAAANWLTAHFGLVPVGFGLAVTAGTFAAGFALVARDWVQVTSGRRIALAAILVGAILSAATSNAAIALASGIAFLVSELVDLGVFTPLRLRSLPLAVLASSVVSAPVDTVLFLSLAGFGVTWQAVAGQFLVKTLIAGAVALYLSRRRTASERCLEWKLNRLAQQAALVGQETREYEDIDWGYYFPERPEDILADLQIDWENR